MEVKLIPVIEIYCINEDVEMPKGAYEDYPAEWNQYHLECNRRAGFTEVLTEYLPGSSLYRAIDLTPPSLKKLLVDAVARMKEDEIEMDELLAFSGGFYAAGKRRS